MKTVEVFLEGGVVHDVHVPDDVEVVIYDYDVEGEDEVRIQCDSTGAECTITKWTSGCDENDAESIPIVDGQPCCPKCGSHDLTHSFDVTYYGILRMQNGELVASHHCDRYAEAWSDDNTRICCQNCGWLCTSLAPDIV